MFEQLDNFIEENANEILITGGWNDEKISELQRRLDMSFREEINTFIKKYGLLLGYGVEIALCGKNGTSYSVDETLNFRELGLDEKYLVLTGDSELCYCLDNETGEIVNWGLDNEKTYHVADNFESFLMDLLVDGKENW